MYSVNMKRTIVMFFIAFLIIYFNDNTLAYDQQLYDAQIKLTELGYKLGKCDGFYGPRTKQALEQFQEDNQLQITGILDSSTLKKLDEAYAEVRTISPMSSTRENKSDNRYKKETPKISQSKWGVHLGVICGLPGVGVRYRIKEKLDLELAYRFADTGYAAELRWRIDELYNANLFYSMRVPIVEFYIAGAAWKDPGVDEQGFAVFAGGEARFRHWACNAELGLDTVYIVNVGVGVSYYF